MATGTLRRAPYVEVAGTGGRNRTNTERYTPMSTKKILQIRYRFDGPFAQFDDILPGFAERMLTVPGLEWKIWAYDETAGEGCGLYLFADGEQAQAYAAPMVAEMGQLMPEVSAHLYDIHEQSTEVTRGPVG